MSSKYLEAVKVSIDLIALKIECLEDVNDRKRATLEIEKFVASFQEGADEKNLLNERNGMKKTPEICDVDDRKKTTSEFERFIASFQEGAGEKHLMLEESHGIKQMPISPSDCRQNGADKRFQCPKCLYCFTKKVSLKRHENVDCVKKMVHMGESQRIVYKNGSENCDVCNFRTTSQKNLREHQIKHSGKIQCSNCKRGFTRKRELARHQLNVCRKLRNKYN